MKGNFPRLPIGPLLRSFRETGVAAQLEPFVLVQLAAIRSAQSDWLNLTFLDSAADAELADRLAAFYESVVPFPAHTAVVRARAGLIRHGINHLLRCPDTLAEKLDRCVTPGGAYHVPGLGLSFWAAVARAGDPDHVAGCSGEIREGLRRLGLLPDVLRERPAATFGRLQQAYRRLRAYAPDLAAGDVHRFLVAVSAMRGRELAGEPEPDFEHLATFATAARLLPHLIRQERTRFPLRRRVKEWGERLHRARERFAEALRAGDTAAVAEALRPVAGPVEVSGSAVECARLLWAADDPSAELASCWEDAGLAFPAAVLHLRDALRFPAWDEVSREGYARLDDGFDPSLPPAVGYPLFAAGVRELCRRHRLHAAEVPGLLAGLAALAHHAPAAGLPEVFGGFCSDTFRFLGELAANNNRAWMDRQRERYRFAVREPMAELCRLLAGRYVGPVLGRELGWEMETDARTGRALTSIVKNDYGQTVPYQPVLWITFYRRGRGGRRADAQLFVRLDEAGLSFGFALGQHAREAGRCLRRNIQERAELLWLALQATGATKTCRFFGDDPSKPLPANGAADLRAWAVAKSLTACRHLPADSPLLRSDDLVGEILLTFEQLLPAFAFAAEEDPRPLLERRLRVRDGDAGYGRDGFVRETFLSEAWLDRALGLLGLKRQMILQGVPGTGKTYVARCLARLLTNDRPENVRLVQFHPAYSYEEFVEGIKARTVEVNGRSEVTYPVEDGVLCEFAARAAARPGEPHVLLVDEINRGNLPRIFGELLYLLEYRAQAVTLPYSRRAFRLPANLYLIGTMNGADRSVTPIDQALRRRFSFLDMPPDPRALAAWLDAHPPRDEAFAPRVLHLFEAVNEHLATDFGPQCRVGHSYFMVPDLDEAKLRAIWQHHVWPILEEYAAGQPARLAPYQFDPLLNKKPRRSPARSDA